jgi:hypothetical protein
MLLVLVSTGIVNAQKGTILVMGNVSYSSDVSKNDGRDNFYKTLAFNPKVGYQFNDNWTIGAETSIASTRMESGETNYKWNQFSIGPFVRYTEPLGDLFSVYGDLGLGYQEYKTRNDNPSGVGRVHGDGFYTAFSPALLLNIKKGFGLNFSLGGLSYGVMKTSGTRNSKFNLDFGKTFTIGISKNF